jgi:PAS domain S-box-containing protein
MIPALPTSDEARRIDALRQYDVFDTPPEQALDDLTALAAHICEAPIALISLVGEDRQWFKAKVGLEMAETPRDISFCGHALHQRDLFIVRDATQDERFADNPMVTGEPGVRFYAGAPLVNGDDAPLGTLCVIDRVPRTLTQAQQQALRVLARQVMTHLDLRRDTRRLAASESRFLLLAENITDVFWIASPDLQKMYYISPGYQRIWGRSPEDLYVNPHQWAEAILPEDRDRVLTVFATLMQSQPSVSIEYRIARPDGSVRWVNDRGFQVRDAAGLLIRLTGIVADITERKQVEIASLRLAAIVESSDDAIIGKDLNSIVTSWNRGAEKIFGYTAREMVGSSIMKLIPEDRRDEENQILGKIKVGESVEHFETLRQTKDGRLITVSVTASPIKDASGKPIGVSKVARDITERKQAEQARLALEERYRALFEYAPDGIVIADPESHYIDANSSICRMLGYTRDELIGLHASDIVVHSEIQQIEPALKIIKSKADYHREWQFRRKDSSVFAAEVIAAAMPDGNLLGMIRDITDRKRDQEQIAEQAALLEKARDAILVCDLRGTVLFWNNGAEQIYGWTRQETMGRNIVEFLYADSKKFKEFNELILRQGEWSGELQHFTRDKREISVESRMTLIRDNEGLPKSVLAINTDITDRKSIEAQLMRAQRMESIGTLAGGIAHDLNNILSPIILSIGVLKAISDQPQAGRMLEIIETSAKRGSDIVRQVLSFARGVESQKTLVQPKHLLKDLENIIKDTFPKDIRLQFSAPSEAWTILGDPTQMQQILLNLCVNARDAMPNGGNLTVAVENSLLDEQYATMHIEAKPGRYVIISITDSGSGIPREHLDKIFMPFFTTKDLNKGTGLGLSTVMAIVKSHDGFVNVYSEPGKGSTFKVYLPAMVISPEAREQASAKASLPRGNGEMVLVVDDEPSILTVTNQTLQAFGYRVLTATDGADAVAVYVQHKNEIAVILTDMMMPVMDGAAVIHALKRINPGVKIIAASGLNAYGGLVNASGAGIKHFLTKPYTAETLLTALRTILDECLTEVNSALDQRETGILK